MGMAHKPTATLPFLPYCRLPPPWPFIGQQRSVGLDVEALQQLQQACRSQGCAAGVVGVSGCDIWDGGGGGGVWIRARTHTKPNSGKTGSARRKIKMDEGTVRPKGKKNLQHKASEKVWLWVASAVSQF